jgi:hypothetical protein
LKESTNSENGEKSSWNTLCWCSEKAKLKPKLTASNKNLIKSSWNQTNTLFCLAYMANKNLCMPLWTLRTSKSHTLSSETSWTNSKACKTSPSLLLKLPLPSMSSSLPWTLTKPKREEDPDNLADSEPKTKKWRVAPHSERRHPAESVKDRNIFQGKLSGSELQKQQDRHKLILLTRKDSSQGETERTLQGVWLCVYYYLSGSPPSRHSTRSYTSCFWLN